MWNNNTKSRVGFLATRAGCGYSSYWSILAEGGRCLESGGLTKLTQKNWKCLCLAIGFSMLMLMDVSAVCLGVIE